MQAFDHIEDRLGGRNDPRRSRCVVPPIFTERTSGSLVTEAETRTCDEETRGHGVFYKLPCTCLGEVRRDRRAVGNHVIEKTYGYAWQRLVASHNITSILLLRSRDTALEPD